MGIVNAGQEATAGKLAMTSFIGRRRELTEAKKKMTESRLVTLTGPGGVGKTRLSTELAHRSRRAFRDGVWLVELDGLAREARVAPAVATALSVPDQSNRAAIDRVVDYVRDKQLLLVLDNCEHVLQGAAELVSRLLAAAPKVRVLATSREPLGISGESVCVVPPLSTPSTDAATIRRGIDHFESVNLLVDRARSVVTDFAVTDENRAAVAQLCARLDGMPLAIELAATRLRSLSVTQLVERLDQRFQLLNRGDRTVLPRQQTLQALIDWSYELCTAEEQLLWRRLSIFSESFGLEAAERVCGFGDLDAGEVLDLLDQLVAKSVLAAERTDEEVRYRQLVTIREYGAQLLADTSERDELSRRHRDDCLRWSNAMVEQWCGPRQARFLATARTDRPNLMAALDWSLTTAEEQSTAAEIASALRFHWIAGGFLSDGRSWLDRILALDLVEGPERGDALWVAGWVCLIQGDHQAADAYLRECRQLVDTHEDPVLRAHAQHWTALHHLFTGDLATSIDLYGEVIAAHEANGDTGSRLTALFQLAMAQVFAGDPEVALHTCRTALGVSGHHGEQWTRAYSLWVAGVCHWHLGDHRAARASATEALQIQKNFQDGICTALTIELLSWVAASTAECERALELSHAAESVWRGLGTSICAFGPHIEQTSRESAERIRQALGYGSGSSVAAGGTDLTKKQAIAVALGTVSRKKTAPVEANLHPLTKREMEIAELVAEGLTNRLIAQKLVLSRRTVDGHVERILTKLDFSSRTQIATWTESMRSVA